MWFIGQGYIAGRATMPFYGIVHSFTLYRESARINIGFGLLMRTITGLTLKLTGLVARIALAPFKLAGSAIGGLLGLGKGILKAPARAIGKVPITASGGRVLSRGGGFLNRFLGGVRGMGNIFKGGGAKAGAKFV